MKLEICMYTILKSNVNFIISGISESCIISHKILQKIVPAFYPSQNVNGMI